MKRISIRIEGIVQGVGFRPFVYREAVALALGGWVLNDSRGVLIEAEGPRQQLDVFLNRLQTALPPLASITRLEQQDCPIQNESTFSIRQSASQSDHNAQIAPDANVCPDCQAELFTPDDRRYRYPFINCTNCGPRYSIVTGIPYDRPKTTMVDFPMCPSCQSEYDDPASRRFHAQPNACPVCGPQLQLLNTRAADSHSTTPLEDAIALLKQGRIVAIKGLGGYHLAVDAANADAVRELRRRKARDEKPFALMSRDLEQVRHYARVNPAEAELIGSVERPIVLLEKLPDCELIATEVAPNNRYLGVMLPYTPLHDLLLEKEFSALVMTSGNLSDEPIAFTDADACTRLNGIADAYLTHNRAIHTRTDDSITRVMDGRPLILRRSRGHVPRSIPLPAAQENILAVGAELKNCFCLTRRDRAFLSHHIGDLKNMEAYRSFEEGIAHLEQILEWQPQAIAHDLHPDYLSTAYALEQGLPTLAVQHHHAHLAACMAENNHPEPCIGMIFDGIGYGEDGQIWGGEFLLGDFSGYRRLGHFAYLAMPGGDAATRQPWRMGVSALVHACGTELPPLPFLAEHTEQELRLLTQMIEKEINSPLTSSCGRLFDAVASIVGLRGEISYEGQAALELEMVIDGDDFPPYPFELEEREGQLIFDPALTLREIVKDVQEGVAAGDISGRFHLALAEMIGAACTAIRAREGVNSVALSGGVFQNRFLTENAARRLRAAGFNVLTHATVPPNDGGLALGQAVIAGARLRAQRA